MVCADGRKFWVFKCLFWLKRCLFSYNLERIIWFLCPMMTKNFSKNWIFSAGPELYLYSDLKIKGGAAGKNFNLHLFC